MSRPIRNVTIEPFKTGNGSRLGGVSYLYRVRDAAGDVILERSRVPLHDAARVLAGRGEFGTIVMVRHPSGSPCMQGDVLALSLQTVKEQGWGPCVQKFNDHPHGAAL